MGEKDGHDVWSRILDWDIVKGEMAEVEIKVERVESDIHWAMGRELTSNPRVGRKLIMAS